ncbi:g6254 [Coccomyxa elongata]
MLGESHSSVLQELLLALLGCPGDIFIKQPRTQGLKSSHLAEPRECDLRLAEDLDWISPPDRENLDSLVTLGYHFRELDAFVSASRSHQRLQRNSMMWRGLATGLTELLEVYRAAVLQTQQQLRRMPAISLASLHFALQDFKVLSPALHRLVYQVQKDKLQGSQLLHMLHGKASCGIPEIQSCSARLLWHCNQILLDQVAAWTMHGILQDCCKEFFIQPTYDAGNGPALTANGLHQDDEQHAREWHSGFQVVEQALPPGVTKVVARRILFIGKAVRVLKHTSNSSERAGDKNLPKLETRQWAAALRRLRGNATLERLDFEHVIEKMHAQAAEQLWQLVTVRAELPQHLAALKQYFLLSRGDFFQCFLLESRRMLQLPPRLQTVDTELNRQFQQAAMNSSADSDPFFNNISIRFATSSGSDKATPSPTKQALQVPSLDHWDAICLDYRLKWPLHILLTPEVMDKYNALFRHLLRLKRVSMELEAAWAASGRQQSMPAGAHQGTHQHLWQARHNMTHLISNLQIYMQVDVIEAQCTELDKQIAHARDFKDAETAHEAFLTSLIEQSFLDMPPLAGILEAIYSLCLGLCSIVQRNQEAVQARESTALLNEDAAAICSGFCVHTAQLYALLQSNTLQAPHRVPHLRQLLLRLNFNHFMEREAAQHAQVAGGPNEHKPDILVVAE